MSKITIDRYDLALLGALQRKGNATNATLGEQIRLSASQISRRIQRLEEDGVIASYVALLAPSALGLGITAFAQVILERHGETASEAFENAVAAMPEVMDCFSVSGDADYMLRIVVPDLACLFRTDDETPAAPARHRPHQDQHCSADDQSRRTSCRSIT
jgi:Lrp/AsnC family leucine-responsive transcriptional regulator